MHPVQAIYRQERSASSAASRPPEVPRRDGRRKLRMLDSADKLGDMSAVPGNRLEALGGDRKGQHSIRINDQWRICFVWHDGAAEQAEIVDYH